MYENGALSGGANPIPQRNDYENAKMADACQNMAAYRPPTLREQAEKSVAYHSDQAQKHNAAAAFFRDNPAFEEFVQLLRSGAFQI